MEQKKEQLAQYINKLCKQTNNNNNGIQQFDANRYRYKYKYRQSKHTLNQYNNIQPKHNNNNNNNSNSKTHENNQYPSHTPSHTPSYPSTRPLPSHTSKIIKYNKYPIYLTQNITCNSDNYKDCTIVYRVQAINIKQLTLRFLKDRRKYTINKVKIIVPAGINVKHKRNQQRYREHSRQDQHQDQMGVMGRNKNKQHIKANKLTQGERQGERQRGNQNTHKYKNNTDVIAKAMRAMQILSCLGATVTLEEQKPYSMYGNGQKVQCATAQMIAFAMAENIQKIWELYSKYQQNIGFNV